MKLLGSSREQKSADLKSLSGDNREAKNCGSRKACSLQRSKQKLPTGMFWSLFSKKVSDRVPFGSKTST